MNQRQLSGLYLRVMCLGFVLLSACSNQEQPIPTLVIIPTDPPTPVAAVFSGSPSPVAVVTMDATPTLSLTPLDANVPTLTSIAQTAALTNPPPSSQTDDPQTDDPQTDDPNSPPTITLTPSKTITSTITPTITIVPTDTRQPSALEELVLTALVSTVLPPNFASTPGTGGIGTRNAPIASPTLFVPTLSACSFPPTGGFGTFFNTNPTLRQGLGCPLGGFNVVRPGASQVFQQGLMIWASGTPSYIYVIYSNATYQRFADTFNEATDPISGGETPPTPNLIEPVRGFGKIWRENPSVRAGLGWATANEQGGTATSLDYERGIMLHISTRGEMYAFVGLDTGAWQVLFGNP